MSVEAAAIVSHGINPTSDVTAVAVEPRKEEEAAEAVPMEASAPASEEQI